MHPARPTVHLKMNKTRADEERTNINRPQKYTRIQQEREISHVITVLVVLQIVVWPRASEFSQVLLVVELQEVGSLPAEAQEGRRQAAREGHEALGAADTEERMSEAAFPNPARFSLVSVTVFTFPTIKNVS